jgi:prolyl oligopeptidase
VPATANGARDPDPYLWLAQIHGGRALEWVRRQNARTDAVLTSDPRYERFRMRILSMLNAQDRIPFGDLEQQWVFNFWQGKGHPRGLWRRTTTQDYAHRSPHWQTLLDLDELDQRMRRDWVWQGAQCAPGLLRCLISLSPAGGDAVIVQEYDLQRDRFMLRGFSLPLAKSTATYLDDDTILFASDLGRMSLTRSSYPRIVKLWRRGQRLSAARILFAARAEDVEATPQVFRGPYGSVGLVLRQPDFFNTDYYVLRADDTLQQLPLPQDAQLQGVTRGILIATLQRDWRRGDERVPAGSLIGFDLLRYRAQGSAPAATVLYSPGERTTIEQVAAGQDAVYASVYHDVTGTIEEFRPAGKAWQRHRLALPEGGSTRIVAVNERGPEAQFLFESFLAPPTLYQYDGSGMPQVIKRQPARFPVTGLKVHQYWAESADGVRVPYFLIGPREARSSTPTILYAYGGFQESLTPWYWDDAHRPLAAGLTWLSRGGAIAVANIRGGGEFGPAWHDAALTVHRQRAFDDFEAVAADLESRGLTTAAHLGIVGASNGGLLVSTAMVQRPALFGAVVCQRPLIDMLRYTQYGAGASWTAEYGDPGDPRMAAYLRHYSPYENVRRSVDYPPVLFITETSDDRVTPVFARMMAAKMQAQGHSVLFSEALEGGHGAGATHAEEADYWALSYVFLAQHLGLKGPAAADAAATGAAP